MTDNIKVLVIDDEPQIQKLLKITLEVNDYEYYPAVTAKEGIRLAASIMPDIILLDLNLPDDDGLSILKQIRQWSKAQIIVLSVRNSEKDKINLLDNGADDYLTKPFHTGELLARLRVAMRHKDVTSNDIQKILIANLEIDLVSRSVKKNGVIINLTSTEYALLKLLAINQNKVLTHSQILDKIWGNSFSDETQYLRVFIGQLRKKIEDNTTNPKFIKTISGVGYIMQNEID